jgi:hypothetical protein
LREVIEEYNEPDEEEDNVNDDGYDDDEELTWE